MAASKIIESLNEINAGSFENDGQRIEAVAAAYALVARLETPWDFVLRTVMGQVSKDDGEKERKGNITDFVRSLPSVLLSKLPWIFS